MRGSKRRAQAVHARRRALERFGLELSERDERELVRQIQVQQASFVSRTSCRTTVWDVRLPTGRIARVVYDSLRKSIVTFLYPDK